MARFWSVRYRGHSLMVKLQPSKLAMRVRFSLPAPICSASRLYADKTGVLNNSFRTSSRSSLVWPHKFTVLARLNRIPCCQRFLTVKRLAASSQSHSSAFSQPQNLPAQHEGNPKSPYMRHPVTTRNISLKTSKMDAQLQRTATAACSGSANFGQVMATSRRVNLGDFDCCYLVMGDYFREDDAMLGRQPAQRR
jgi:hypothetical protein